MPGIRSRSFVEFHCSAPVPLLLQVLPDEARSSATPSCRVIRLRCILLLLHRSRLGPCEIMGKGRRWLRRFLFLGCGDAHACSIVRLEAGSFPALLRNIPLSERSL